MKYYRIGRTYDPKIIGITDGACQVEICNKTNKNSFENDKEQSYFKTFCEEAEKDRRMVSIDTFTPIDREKISTLTLFKTRKRVKEVDILYYMVNEVVFQFVFSQKLIDIIDQFKLPPHNRIPVKIEEFDSLYYLVGFPVINLENYDINNCIFYDNFKEKSIMVKTIEEYKAKEGWFWKNKYISLKKNYDYDILRDYFSERLIKEIKKYDVKALEIYENIILEHK